ncbi:amyloid beta A4 precursor protein-binding family B member 1-interacting protein-like [Ixodes scapularis]|uniref:amyloid beta A4 precursor protein-binding family B member 1-interacting protein-like n=1 Tax=Ixodes scapularis TaxID=6945 RepID=UPI001A9E6DF0|nr:amyloid beta A4 precursor protein-binding family B member 1-interacting protein-like [Ixodes scapularis]
MPPKQVAPHPDDDQSSDNESDTPGVVRALESHAERIEDLVHADRMAANQTLERLLQDAQRHQESNREIADAVANAVGRALAQGLHHAGAPPPIPPPPATQPPITSFGGLRLQGGPAPDSQPPIGVPPPADPWPPLSQSEFQPTPATHTAAVTGPDPRYQQQPFGLAASDTGRFFAPYEYPPTQPYNIQVAGRQHIFTVQDPPTKRDIAEAFIHVQHAARHSPHIGKREITELQLLECFVQVWDCHCTGLPNRDKLKIFDRV